MNMKLRKANGEEGHILVKSFEMEDPTFESESPHVARATFSNPKSISFTFTSELYLGKTVGSKVVTSGVQSLTVPAKGTATKDFSVNMPALTIPSDIFHCYLEIKEAGVLVITFIADTDVTVIVTPAINVTGIVWT